MTVPGAFLEALATASLPDVRWQLGDDRCDCTFQRIGWWTNPYLAETLEIRLCCVWAELGKQYPDLVRTVPAFYDYTREEWVTEPREWDGEAEMPPYLWYRQLAAKEGKPLAEIRSEYQGRDDLRPKGKKQEPRSLWLNSPWGWVPLELE